MTRIAGANLIGAVWIAWTIYWIVAAQSAKQDQRQESAASRAGHIVPLAIAAWLLWAPSLPGHFLAGRFVPDTLATFWIGVAILIAGLGFSIWARRVLGRNWSGIVTVKQDHELIERGPYRWVRHPIYTGLLIAFVGTAISRGEWRGLLAVAIVFAGLWRKLKLEERWMIETFGDAYLRYRERVRALIPFVL
jgi:protein-S-isoprenylcysteine O-methyltransferase Ste14